MIQRKRVPFPLGAALVLSVGVHGAIIWVVGTIFVGNPVTESIGKFVTVEFDGIRSAPQSQSNPILDPLVSEVPESVVDEPQRIENPPISHSMSHGAAPEEPSVQRVDVSEMVRTLLSTDDIKAFSGATERSVSTALGRARTEREHYIDAWERKVQRIGQLNYPQSAAAKDLYGKLSLFVSISHDGSLNEVRVVESSGHEELDSAALRIVKLSAPYAPFSARLRNATQSIEMIKTWEFRRNSSG